MGLRVFHCHISRRMRSRSVPVASRRLCLAMVFRVPILVRSPVLVLVPAPVGSLVFRVRFTRCLHFQLLQMSSKYRWLWLVSVCFVRVSSLGRPVLLLNTSYKVLGAVDHPWRSEWLIPLFSLLQKEPGLEMCFGHQAAFWKAFGPWHSN